MFTLAYNSTHRKKLSVVKHFVFTLLIGLNFDTYHKAFLTVNSDYDDRRKSKANRCHSLIVITYI